MRRADSTLKSYTKDELINIIRIQEYNISVYEEQVAAQYKNGMKMIVDMAEFKDAHTDFKKKIRSVEY